MSISITGILFPHPLTEIITRLDPVNAVVQAEQTAMVYTSLAKDLSLMVDEQAFCVSRYGAPNTKPEENGSPLSVLDCVWEQAKQKMAFVHPFRLILIPIVHQEIPQTLCLLRNGSPVIKARYLTLGGVCFDYWNSSDAPIPQDEWEIRRKIWADALKPDWVPETKGIVWSSSWVDTQDLDLDKVLQNVPDKEDRIEEIAKGHLFGILTEGKDGLSMYKALSALNHPDNADTLRALKEAIRPCISDITRDTLKTPLLL